MELSPYHPPFSGPPSEVTLPSGSWLGILASTMGIHGLGRARIQIRGSLHFRGEMRLVVQLFEPAAVHSGGRNRPVAAAQRVVNVLDLQRGIVLSILHEGIVSRDVQVVAWLERGSSELEFGALTATPTVPFAIRSGRITGQMGRIDFSSTGAEAVAA